MPEHINFTEGTILVRQQMLEKGEVSLRLKTKNSRRPLQMFEPVKLALFDILALNWFRSRVFCGSLGRPMLGRSVGDHPWRRAVARARVDYSVHYNLRHTYTTLMIRAGKPLQWIAHQLGHVGVKKIDEVYGRWARTPEAQALDLEAFLLAIMQLPKRAVVLQPPPNLSQTVSNHADEHDIALLALEHRRIAASDVMAEIGVFADTLQQHRLDELGLPDSNQRDDADGAPGHLGGRQQCELLHRRLSLGEIAIGVILSAVCYMDIDQRRRKALGRLGQADRDDFLRVELEAEADDGLDAAEMFSQSDAPTRIAGERQLVKRISRKHQGAKMADHRDSASEASEAFAPG